MGQLLITHPLGAVSLRPYRASDSDADHELEADPVVKQFLGGPTTETADARLARFDPEKINAMGWRVVATVPDDALVGRVGLYPQPEFPGQLEMTIVLARSHMGRGLGRIIAKHLVEEGFEDPTIEAIRAGCDPAHEASLALLEAMGFVETSPGYGDRYEQRDAFILPRERWEQGAAEGNG